MFGGGALVYDRARPGWRARLRRAWRRAVDVLDPTLILAVLAKHASPDEDRLSGELTNELDGLSAEQSENADNGES